MNSAVFVLFTLGVSSLMLAVIFAIAWNGFGRPRHALTWSVAYGLATVEWTVNLGGGLWWPEVGVLRPLAMSLGLLFWTVLVYGFRQRAELEPRALLLAPLAAAGCVVVFVASVAWPDTVWDRAPVPLYHALMLGLCALTLVREGELPNAAERSAFVVLVLFAVYNLLVGAATVVQGGLPDIASQQAYRTLMLLGTPTAFIALGFFAVFLLAADLAEKMRRLAILDPLTSILNRRGLEQAAAAAIANSQRADQPLTVVLADMDRFKQINDSFGHAAGDRALQRFARHVESVIRKGDCFGRVGGEEFALLLMNTAPPQAMEVTERIRAGVERLDAGAEGEVRLTASFGVAGLEPDDGTLADIMVRADQALYRSKVDGRNRVTLADAAAVPPPRAPAIERRAAPRQPVPLR